MATKSLVEVDPTTNVVKNGVKIPSAQLSDATTVGKSVVTATTAAAARSAIGALDKPTGKTGQLVYNATTGTWEALPAAGAPLGRLAHIGDSLTHRAPEENVISWYRGVGFDATAYGCDGKEINVADTNGKTTLQNMADVRAVSGEPGVWVIRLGTNLTNAGDGGVTMKAGMDAVIAAAGSTPVAWVSTAIREDLDAFEGGGWPFRYYVNEAVREKVEAAGGLYIDLWQWTIANDPKDGSWWSDGVHNTPLGYQKTYEYITSTVAQWVRSKTGGGSTGGTATVDTASAIAIINNA